MGPWQREKSVKMMNSRTGKRAVSEAKSATSGSVDNLSAQPYLCRNLLTAIALILLGFSPLNLSLPESHLIGGCPWVGASAAMRHGELIGNLVDHVTALDLA